MTDETTRPCEDNVDEEPTEVDETSADYTVEETNKKEGN